MVRRVLSLKSFAESEAKFCEFETMELGRERNIDKKRGNEECAILLESDVILKAFERFVEALKREDLKRRIKEIVKDSKKVKEMLKVMVEGTN